MSDADKLNNEWMGFHLDEAREELERIRVQVAVNDIDEEDLRISMQHLYHHLNTAWNSRFADHQTTSAASQTDFDTWRKFPEDLKLI